MNYPQDLRFDFSSEEATEATRQRLRDLCKRSLFTLCTVVLGMNKAVKHVHGTLSKFLDDTPVPGWGHRDDLLVLLPRGYFKSSFVTIGKTIQNIIRNPAASTLIVNEKIENAENFLKSIRSQWQQNRMLRWLYPELIPDIRKVAWSNHRIEMRRPPGYDRPEGTVDVVGVDGTVVSRHYDVIILDDLIADAASCSPTLMQHARNWVKLAEHLFVDGRVGQMYMMGTRWAYDDIYKDLIDDPTVRKFILPGEIDGKSTFPERFPDDHLAKMRQKEGPYFYSCQVLLNPIHPDNADFKESWLMNYDLDIEGGAIIPLKDGLPQRQLERKDLYVAMMVDPGTDSKIAKSRTAVVTAAKDNSGRVFVLDVWARYGASSGDVVDAVIHRYRRFRPSKIGWEANGFMNLYAQTVKEKAHARSISLPIVTRKAGKDGDKNSRIRSLDGVFESGAVYIRKSQKEFVEEYITFPMSQKKDVLDALWYLVDGGKDGPLLRYPDGRQFSREDDSSNWHEKQLDRHLSQVSAYTGYGA
ncbi:MAG: hypothetical protein QME66_08330 [Candidatus Eisenbacteria bacterium]|nr:hypothetical protein [Candidatus Eisenbacteria bacterium]